LLCVIAVSSVVTSILFVYLQGCFQSEQRLRDELTSRVAMNQLATRFRRDAHQAISVETTDDAQTGVVACSLDLPQQYRVLYACDETAVTRMTERDGSVVGRERYTLPKGTAARWATQSTGDARLVTLHLRPKSVSDRPRPAAGRVLRIDAALGLDRRFTSPAVRE
jgi:hypothetical protein